MFNSCIRPILTYTSDIWGINKLGRDKIDKIFLKFLKNLLGVKQSTSSLMVLGETGQFLPSSDCISNVSKYLNRVRNMNDGCITKQVYNELVLLDSCGFDTWYSRASDLVHKYSLESNPNLQKYKLQAKNTIQNDFIRDWYGNIQKHIKNPICRTYSLFKFQFKMEPYLIYIQDRKLRRSLTLLRTSSHALGIETSRHRQNNNQKESNRLCSTCNTLDDEIHFLLHCSRFSE